MVIPDIQLWNGAIGTLEWLLSIPIDVIVEVVVITSGTHVLAKGEMLSLPGITNVRPFLQGTIHSNTIIVDLIAPANHDMERLGAVHAEDVVPESRPAPGVDISSNAESVAGVEHDAHGLCL